MFSKKSTKSTASKDASSAGGDALGDASMPVKQLDSRVGMDCYRDFYTLKNYWKTVQRKQKESADVLMYRWVSLGWGCWGRVGANRLT